MRKYQHPFTLETYISFLENPFQHDLTIKHLNQIINLHGFKKLHRQPKRNLYYALSSMSNLQIPFRSTLQESSRSRSNSSSASLKIDEVVEDLEALQWQECSVQSIETLGGDSEKAKKGVGQERFGSWGMKKKRKSIRTRSINTCGSGFDFVPVSGLVSI